MNFHTLIKTILIFLLPTTIFSSQGEIGISGGIKILKAIAQWFYDGMNIIKLGQALTNENSSTWYIIIGVAMIWGFFNFSFKDEEE